MSTSFRSATNPAEAIVQFVDFYVALVNRNCQLIFTNEMMMKNPKKAPYAMKFVLFYANARPTERSWRSVVLGRRVGRGAEPDRLLPEGSAAGESSFEEVRDILDRFRSIVERVRHVRDPSEEVVQEIGKEILQKGRAEIEWYRFQRDGRRFYIDWRTASGSFTEALYANLGIAIQQCSVDSIRSCSECSSLFYDGSKRSVEYCSARCRKRGTIRVYRRRNPEAYREYQRKLMARRRTEGKDT